MATKNTPRYTRRHVLAAMSGMTATFAFDASASLLARRSATQQTEGRYAFRQGVASADPTPDGVVLWTRIVPVDGGNERVDAVVQVSRSPDFARLVLEEEISTGPEANFTVRVIVRNLRPGSVYFYRFIAGADISHPLGRTITAPAPSDAEPVNFAVVACQHHQLGYMSAYRDMIAEDEAKPAHERIQFLLHLGDFVYEEVFYPEDRPNGRFLRRPVRDTLRYPDGGRAGTLRYPVTLADYRYLYESYLSDPDLIAARARWPFICIWDDHEFSNNCWQSQQMYDEPGHPAQRRKLAANQAWFEFIPALLTGAPAIDHRAQHARDFAPVEVSDEELGPFDDNYLGTSSANLAALNSLTVYRALRWGAHIDLLITDNRSYRSPPPFTDAGSEAFGSPDLGWFYPEELVAPLDAGRTFNGGTGLPTLTFAGAQHPNPRHHRPAGTVLGAKQKRWFKDCLAGSGERWKIWANSFGSLPRRLDFANLPAPERAKWRGADNGFYGNDDWVVYPGEYREILDHIRTAKIANVVSLAGDRHNFLAGYMTPTLPPEGFAPVAVEFGISALSSPVSFEGLEYGTTRRPTIRDLFVAAPEGVEAENFDALEPNINVAMAHGVCAALSYSRGGNLDAALTQSNRTLAPHLSFIDMSSNGYATARADGTSFTVEFRAILRPISETEGTPATAEKYRVTHKVAKWQAGAQPTITRAGQSGQLPIPYRFD